MILRQLRHTQIRWAVFGGLGVIISMAPLVLVGLREGFRLSDLRWLAIFVPPGIVCASVGTFYLLFPEKHPLLRRLKLYGGPRELARKIDAELNDPIQTTLVGRLSDLWGWRRWPVAVAVSRHWMVSLSPTAQEVVALPLVVWVYKQLTVRRLVWSPTIVPGVTCHLLGGRTCWFWTRSETDADELLEAIVSRRPELLTGFRGEWIDLAAASAAALSEEVERRLANIRNFSPAQRERWIEDRLGELEQFVRRIDPANRDPWHRV